VSPFEIVEQPVARLSREGIYTLVNGTIFEGFFRGSLHYLDELDLHVVWCDDDGITDYETYGPWTDTLDDKGCVWVHTHAEIMDVQGPEVEVLSAAAAEGGMYHDNEGNPYLRIYFPGSRTVSLQEFDSVIKLGCCEDRNPQGYKTLGSIYIKNMKVTIHGNSWTDIWVEAD